MKKTIIYYLILLSVSVYSYPISKEVAINTATSLSFLQSKDSLLLKYEKAKKLYEDKELTTSLRIALALLKKENLTQELQNQLNFLVANIFYSIYDSKSAIKYYRKVLKNFENIYSYIDDDNNFNKKNEINLKYNSIYTESLLRSGNSYLKLSYTSKEKKNKDSLLYYFNKIIKKNSTGESNQSIKAKALSTLSGVFMNDSLYDIAKDYALQSIRIHKKLNNKISQSITLGNLSSIYLEEGDYEKAKEICFEAIDLIKDINTDKALKIREDLYYNLAYNLYKLKDYTAYDYQELSYLIKDSIRDKQFREIIAEINAEFNFEDKKDYFLKIEENKRLKAQRGFWIAGVIGVLIILSLLYWVNFYKLKQKNLGLKLSQTELLQSQKLEKLKSESQIRILNATIDGKETERKQIAETLHDSVSALLSSANLHLQATKTAFLGKTPIEIDKTREIITEASYKIRDLSHTLVSSVLLKFGLKFAIKDMAKKYSNSQIEITANVGLVRRYEQDFEIKVHNITQEFLNNILKHSEGTKAGIKLEEEEKILYLKVIDNGKGFDQNKITDKDGLGINQIKARIMVMQGKFVIDSTIGKGTLISVEIPIKEKEVIYHA